MTADIKPTRRDVLAGASATGAALLATSAKSATKPSRPAPRGPSSKKYNILLIVNDQERALADIPSVLPLPAHDWLKQRGVSFTNFNVNTSPCGPSRSVMFTGQHTQHTRMYANPNGRPYPEMSPELPTLGHMLREAGYYTAYKGKWHLTNINEKLNFKNNAEGIYPNGRDVLEPFGFSNYNFNGERVGLSWDGFMDDGTTAAEAVNMLDSFKQQDAGDKPWFLTVNFVNPHDIMFFDAAGDGEKTRVIPNLIAPLLEAPGHPIYAKDWKIPLPRSFYLDDLSTKPAAHRAVNAGSWAFYGKLPHANEAAWETFQNYYFNCIRDADRHMLTVLEALERNGQADNTIVIFTSDHGERGSAHGMRQKAGTIYKEDIGVPFVVVHPDFKGGVTTPALGSTLDIVPTVLAMAGVSADALAQRHPQIKGFDLSPALGSATTRTMRDTHGILLNYAIRYGWNFPDVAPGVEHSELLKELSLTLRRLFRGVHDGRYKFARYFAPAQHHTPKTWQDLTAYNDLELYDLQNDPDEIHNLAFRPDAHKETILRLNAMTNALIAREVGVDNGSEYPGDVSQYNTI